MDYRSVSTVEVLWSWKNGRAGGWLVPAKEGVVAQRKPVQGAFQQKRPWDPVL